MGSRVFIKKKKMISEAVKKIIEYQITEGMTEAELCSKIGFHHRTLFNLRQGKSVSDSTLCMIDNFIKKNKL